MLGPSIVSFTGLNVGTQFFCQNITKRRDVHARRLDQANVGVVEIAVVAYLLAG